MKTKTIVLISILFIGFRITGSSQVSPDSADLKYNGSMWMHSLRSNLRGAQVFNSVVNCLEIIGYPVFLSGITKYSSTVAFVGFSIGFPGMEMSKYSPVPLTKARRDLIRLRPFWKDTADYNRLNRQVTAAMRLSYASMALAFGAQAMVMIGIFSQEESASANWIISGFVCAGVSLGLSVGTTVVTSVARKTLGKHGGTLGLNMNQNGIGAVYQIP
jgi:hypothetical protein